MFGLPNISLSREREMKVLAKKAGAKKRIDLKNATTREILSFSLLPFGLLTIVNVIGNALNVYLADYLGIGMVGADLGCNQRPDDGYDCGQDPYQVG